MEKLDITFHSVNGDVHAVRGISFSLQKGETLAIVGESGCGKSVTAKAILRLLDDTSAKIGGESEILYGGKNLLTVSRKEMDRIRGKEISMVFQDSSLSLNPVMKVGRHLVELIRDHEKTTKKEAGERAISLLRKVELPDPEDMMNRYPHELSGGQKQRVMIAMAIALDPAILIADEPTTALDVTVQAQILKLLKRLQAESGMSIILITHDLGIVAGFADHIQVMYGGEILERGRTKELFQNPHHPYTAALLKAIPGRTLKPGTKLYSIPGTPPDLRLAWDGCPFAPRCQFAMGICRKKEPPVFRVPETKAETESAESGHLSGIIVATGKGDPAGDNAVFNEHRASCWLMDTRAPNVSFHDGSFI